MRVHTGAKGLCRLGAVFVCVCARELLASVSVQSQGKLWTCGHRGSMHSIPPRCQKQYVLKCATVCGCIPHLLAPLLPSSHPMIYDAVWQYVYV